MATTPIGPDSAKTITPANEKSQAASSAPKLKEGEESKQQSKSLTPNAVSSNGDKSKSQGLNTPAPESSMNIATSDDLISAPGKDDGTSQDLLSSPDVTPGL